MITFQGEGLLPSEHYYTCMSYRSCYEDFPKLNSFNVSWKMAVWRSVLIHTLILCRNIYSRSDYF